MIKAVFFDFDGVLTDFDCGSYNVCYNLHQKTGIPVDTLLSCYDKCGRRLYLGSARHKDIWGDFCRCVGQKIDIKLLDYAFRNTPMNGKMLDLARKLRKDYKVGIITDNSRERFYLIVEEFGLRDIFDIMVLSADAGGEKKDALIFQKALDALNLKAENCVFIDNSKRNLEIPVLMGFKTIFYDFEERDFDSLLVSLRDSGVKV